MKTPVLQPRSCWSVQIVKNTLHIFFYHALIESFIFENDVDCHWSAHSSSRKKTPIWWASLPRFCSNGFFLIICEQFVRLKKHYKINIIISRVVTACLSFFQDCFWMLIPVHGEWSVVIPMYIAYYNVHFSYCFRDESIIRLNSI